MTTYVGKMKHYSIVVTIMGIIAICAFLFTSWQTYALGFLVGLIFGYANLWTVYFKAIAVGRIADRRFNHSIVAYTWAGLGFIIRTILALVAIWIALSYPAHVHLLFTIIGFSFVFIIIFSDTICQFMRRKG